MQFNTYFRLASYATVTAAGLALFVAGGIGAGLALAFAAAISVTWFLEGTRWQLNERWALIVILVSLPPLYFDWRVLTPYLQGEFAVGGPTPRGSAEVTVLAHLILFLSTIKLLQRKGDRDWFFLYLITFFEVLLAAGLSASPTFLATLTQLGLNGSTLVVAPSIEPNLRLAARNLQKIELSTSDYLNTYQVLRSDKLLFTRGAFEKLEERLKD